MRKQILAITCFLFSLIAAEAQSDFEAKYAEFRDKVVGRYSSFRDSCNQKYADFLRTSWEWYEGKAPLPLPKDKKPVPPRPYEGDNGDAPIAVNPVKVDPIVPAPQPKPVEPIRETPTPPAESFTVKFYGQQCQIRLPQCAKIRLYDCTSLTMPMLLLRKARRMLSLSRSNSWLTLKSWFVSPNLIWVM